MSAASAGLTGVERGVGLVDIDATAKFAGDAPVSGDTVAKALDQRVDDMRVPDAPVAGASGGPQHDGAVILALSQGADLLGLPGEPQIEVEAIGNNRDRKAALPEIRCRRVAGRCQGAKLSE